MNLLSLPLLLDFYSHFYSTRVSCLMHQDAPHPHLQKSELTVRPDPGLRTTVHSANTRNKQRKVYLNSLRVCIKLPRMHVLLCIYAQNNSIGPEGPTDLRGVPVSPPSTPNKQTYTLSLSFSLACSCSLSAMKTRRTSPHPSPSDSLTEYSIFLFLFLFSLPKAEASPYFILFFAIGFKQLWCNPFLFCRKITSAVLKIQHVTHCTLYSHCIQLCLLHISNRIQ